MGVFSLLQTPSGPRELCQGPLLSWADAGTHLPPSSCAKEAGKMLSSLVLSQQCKPHKRPVCGSNGKTYLNHCELHRDACLTGSKIQVDYDGHCKGNPVSGSNEGRLLSKGRRAESQA